MGNDEYKNYFGLRNKDSENFEYLHPQDVDSLLELINYFQEFAGLPSEVKTSPHERVKRLQVLMKDFDYLSRELERELIAHLLVKMIDQAESKFIVAKVPARNSLLLMLRFFNLLIDFLRKPEIKLTKLFFTDNFVDSELEKIRPSIKALVENIALVFRLALVHKGISIQEFFENQEPKAMWNRILTNKADIIRLVQFDFVTKKASKEA